jgi:hypothetical protein
LRLLGLIHVVCGEWEPAEDALLDAACAPEGPDPETARGLVLAAARHGVWEEAWTRVRQALAARPGDGHFWALRAGVSGRAARGAPRCRTSTAPWKTDGR